MQLRFFMLGLDTHWTPFSEKSSLTQAQQFQRVEALNVEIPTLSNQEHTRADKSIQGIIWVRVPCPPPFKPLKSQRFSGFFIFSGHLLDTFLQIISDTP